MASAMFRYDEAMTDLIFAACRERLSMDPVSLDFGGLVESLDAELAGLMRPEGNDAAHVLEALRRQAGHGRRVVRQPALLVVHPGRAHQGLAPLRHVRLVLLAARHLLAGGGRGRRGREPGPRCAGGAGRASRRRGRLLRGRRVRRQPLGADGGPRHGGAPAPGRSAAAPARRRQRGRPLLGGQGPPRARRRDADRADPGPPADR